MLREEKWDFMSLGGRGDSSEMCKARWYWGKFCALFFFSIMATIAIVNHGWAGDKSHDLPKVGVLLPLSGENSNYGRILLSGIELGVIDPSTHHIAVDLDIHDISTEGSALAAQNAIKAGDKVILGPLTRRETQDVSSITSPAHIPLISFTSDLAQHRDNVWIMGVTPQEQVQQLVLEAEMEGRRNFSAFLPENGLGHAMGQSLIDMCHSQKLREPKISYHTLLENDLFNVFNDLGLPVVLSAPAEVKETVLSDESDDAKKAQDTSKGDNRPKAISSAITSPPNTSAPLNGPKDKPSDRADVLLLADTGRALKKIAKALPENSITYPGVRIIGPALWSAREYQLDGLKGAWYATLDPRPRQEFVHYYMATQHRIPDPLADLAFDASAAIRTVAQENKGKFPAKSLTRDNGFWGAQGHFVFLGDGRVHRDLSIFEIVGSGHMPQMVALSRDH